MLVSPLDESIKPNHAKNNNNDSVMLGNERLGGKKSDSIQGEH